jgi:hypothetical protein
MNQSSTTTKYSYFIPEEQNYVSPFETLRESPFQARLIIIILSTTIALLIAGFIHSAYSSYPSIRRDLLKTLCPHKPKEKVFRRRRYVQKPSSNESILEKLKDLETSPYLYSSVSQDNSALSPTIDL